MTKLIVGGINNDLVENMVATLREELNKRGEKNYSWIDAPIVDLKHGMMSAIARKDWPAFFTYQCMIVSRGHDPLEHLSGVMDNQNMMIKTLVEESALERSERIKVEGDLKHLQENADKCMPWLLSGEGASLRCVQTPIIGTSSSSEKPISNHRHENLPVVEVSAGKVKVDAEQIHISGNLNLTTGQLETKPEEKPFAQKLAEFLAENMDKWPEGVVAFGPMTSFNGMVGNPHLNNLYVTPDKWNYERRCEDPDVSADGDEEVEDPCCGSGSGLLTSGGLQVSVKVKCYDKDNRHDYELDFYGTPDEVVQAMATMGLKPNFNSK